MYQGCEPVVLRNLNGNDDKRIVELFSRSDVDFYATPPGGNGIHSVDPNSSFSLKFCKINYNVGTHVYARNKNIICIF
jgi:hypothetical protein